MPYRQDLGSEEKRPVRESSMEKSKAGRGLRFSPSGTVRCRVVGLVDRGQRLSGHLTNITQLIRTGLIATHCPKGQGHVESSSIYSHVSDRETLHEDAIQPTREEKLRAAAARCADAKMEVPSAADCAALSTVAAPACLLCACRRSGSQPFAVHVHAMRWAQRR